MHNAVTTNKDISNECHVIWCLKLNLAITWLVTPTPIVFNKQDKLMTIY